MQGLRSFPQGRRSPVASISLLCVLVALALCAPSGTASPAAPNSTGVWRVSTPSYFGATADATSLSNYGSIIAVTDWDGDLNPGLLVLASHEDGSTKPAQVRVSLEFHRNSAATKRDTAFSRQWVAPPLPGDASVVGAITADLRRSGNLDLLLQGSDGHLYIATRRGNGDGAPQVPRPLNITIPPSSVSSRSSSFSTKLRYAASPQVSLATLASDYPSIVFVNENGALVELRWAGRRHSSHGGSSEAMQEEDLELSYEAYEIVRSTLPADVAAAERADGSPVGIQAGMKEVGLSSLAMADIDGDCVPELLYTVRDYTAKTLSLYAYQPYGLGNSSERLQGRQHARLFEFSERDDQELGSFSVADVDGDGVDDFVFPWRRRTGSESTQGYTGVMVFYSRPLASDGCASRRDGKGGADIPGTSEYGYSDTGDALIELSERYCGSTQWRQASDSDASEHKASDGSPRITMPDSTELPLILRSGDYNRDRRVDLLVPSSRGPLILTATGYRGSNTAFKAEEADVAAFTCGYLDASAALAPRGSAAFYRDAVPFFAALSEEVGRLEAVLTTHTTRHDAQGDHLGVAGNAVYSNTALPDRNYYVIASALNGVRPSAESTGRGGFGLGQPGAVHYLAWEDVHMHTRWRRLTQLSHYVGHAMQTPRLLIGLGETFSYVRGFSVGIPAAPAEERDGSHSSSPVAAVRKRQWPSYLVPNSQVFAVLHPVEDPSAWRLQLYLPTSRYRLLLGVALTASLVVLGIPVVLLRWQEMRADHREWKRR